MVILMHIDTLTRICILMRQETLISTRMSSSRPFARFFSARFADRRSAPKAHSHGRGLTEIREIIRRAAISEAAKKTAIAIFEALGAAEAKIHNSD